MFKIFERFKARKGFKPSLETIKYKIEGTHRHTEMEAVGRGQFERSADQHGHLIL